MSLPLTLKQVRRLSHRKAREETGMFFAEGIRVVAEAVQLHAPIHTLVCAPDLLTSAFGRRIVTEQERRGTPILQVSGEAFRQMSRKDGPQGLGAVVRQQWRSLNDVCRDDRPWVALDTVQDPGNLGTILRTCDAVGGGGVILLGTTTDPHDPAAVRASMGAIFSQALARAEAGEFSEWKRRQDAFVVGASGAATRDYREVTYRPPPILLMGSERCGLSPDLQALCDVLVKIPMVGRSDSLNLAVAAGVVLYEIFYHRRSQVHHGERESGSRCFR